MTALFSTAYWPSLHYFFYVLRADVILLEQHEHYGKQSYRNRTQILSANGLLDLSIPIVKKAPKEFSKDLEIAYKENWQIRHWRAITSAYRNSPYFGYFEDEIGSFYQTPVARLMDYNTQQLQLLLKLLKQKKEIRFTPDYEHAPQHATDLREAIHPKIDFRKDETAAAVLLKPYYQTFGNKFGFTPNLSVLDLLFNTGLEAVDHLSDNSFQH